MDDRRKTQLSAAMMLGALLPPMQPDRREFEIKAREQEDLILTGRGLGKSTRGPWSRDPTRKPKDSKTRARRKKNKAAKKTRRRNRK